MTDQQKPPTHLAIPVQLAQQIAGYLAQHPYNEVAQFLAALNNPQQCPPISIDQPGPLREVASAE